MKDEKYHSKLEFSLKRSLLTFSNPVWEQSLSPATHTPLGLCIALDDNYLDGYFTFHFVSACSSCVYVYMFLSEERTEGISNILDLMALAESKWELDCELSESHSAFLPKPHRPLVIPVALQSS